MAQANLTYTYPARVDAGGRAVVTVTPKGMIQWLVRQVSVSMTTAPGAASCQLALNGSALTALVPQLDAADGVPVMVRPSDRLTVEWSSCTPGDQGTVLVLYDEVEWGS